MTRDRFYLQKNLLLMPMSLPGFDYKSNPSSLLIETSSAGVNGYWSNSAL